MEPKDSWQSPQEPATGLSHELHESVHIANPTSLTRIFVSIHAPAKLGTWRSGVDNKGALITFGLSDSVPVQMSLRGEE